MKIRETHLQFLAFYSQGKVGFPFYTMSYLDSFVPETLADEDILARSQANPVLFALLVERYQNALFRYALGIVKNADDAEEVVQSAFTKMYLHAGTFTKQEGASFKSWAYRITFTSAISQYRKQKRLWERETALEPEHYENLGDEDGTMSRTDARLAVDKLLGTLPEDMVRILKKFYMEDKSYEDIALEEGIPLTTLKMRLFRARKLLKNHAYDAYA